MTTRTTFETWVKGRGGDVMKRDGEYLSSMTRLWWECWQAAVRSVATDVPHYQQVDPSLYLPTVITVDGVKMTPEEYRAQFDWDMRDDPPRD